MRSSHRVLLSSGGSSAPPFTTAAHHLRLPLRSRSTHQLRCLSSLCSTTITSSSSLRLPLIDPSGRTFQDLRDRVYVDKTEHLAALMEGPRETFLSRPRRFGKSVLVSTLAAAFMPNGPKKNKLFKGLWIKRNAPHLLKHHLPVLSFDLSALDSSKGPDALEAGLRTQLHTMANKLGVQLPDSPLVPELVSALIEGAAAKTPRKKVVVLIDEYDSPIVCQLEADGGEHGSAMANAKVLAGLLFATIKSHANYIHLHFVTGVSRFGRTSLFSGSNQLVDISLLPRFSSVVGYTRPEIEAAFGPHLAALAAREGLSDREELWNKIAAWYDGYSWGGAEPIFNPWSIGHLFWAQKFDSYWPALGTPAWLLKLLVATGLEDLPKQLGQYRNVADFSKIEIDALGRSSWDNISLLFQTGFLSIADWKEDPTTGSLVRLDFPNQEVRQEMARELFATAFPGAGDFSMIGSVKQALDDNDMARFYELLDAGLRGVPFTTFKKSAAITNAEAHYNSTISLLVSFVLPKGYVVRTEDATSDGQIDLVIETPARIFICEHKILPRAAAAEAAAAAAAEAEAMSGTDSEGRQARMKKLAQEALQQIKHKNYTAKYRADSRPITIAGACFDGHTRGVGYVLIATNNSEQEWWPELATSCLSAP